MDFTYIEANQRIKDAQQFELINQTTLMRFEKQVTQKGIGFEFLLPGLISTVSHLVANSNIHSFGHITTTPCHYTILVAHPSTGKSPALDFSKKLFENIEQYNLIPNQFSALVDGSSPGLLNLITTLSKPNILGLWDDGFVNMYSDSEFKRIIIALHHGPESFEINTRQQRFRISKPRLNFSTNMHPYQMVQLFENEKNGISGGYLYKFLVSAPKPFDFKASQLCENENGKISLQAALFLISTIHKTSRNYKFSEKSAQKFQDVYDLYNVIAKQLLSFDIYTGMILASTLAQIIKITIVLKVLDIAYSKLENFVEAKSESICTKLEDQCKKIAENLTQEDFIIDENISDQAFELIEYFTKHKLALAGFKPDKSKLIDWFQKELNKYMN